MEPCYLGGLGDGGEVHHLILLHHRPAEFAQRFNLLLAEPKSQLRQTGPERLFHFIHISILWR